MQNYREQWEEEVVYGHQFLPGLLSVAALPASGCDWHVLPAAFPEKGKDTAVWALTPMHSFSPQDPEVLRLLIWSTVL